MRVQTTDRPSHNHPSARRIGPIRCFLNAVIGTVAGVLWIAYLAIGSWLMSVFDPLSEGAPRPRQLPDTARNKAAVAKDR